MATVRARRVADLAALAVTVVLAAATILPIRLSLVDGAGDGQSIVELDASGDAAADDDPAPCVLLCGPDAAIDDGAD